MDVDNCNFSLSKQVIGSNSDEIKRSDYRYCFAGVPTNSVIAIGTCGGSPRKYVDRKRFEDGLEEPIIVLYPQTIIVYGSASYSYHSTASLSV